MNLQRGSEIRMRFARIVFSIAAVYGFIVLVPLYFLLDKVGRDAPPPVTHPEFYYGFVGTALLWQVVFVLIATDPSRYRGLIAVAVLEKLVYTVPLFVLYMAGKVRASILGPSLVDPIFGALFFIAYFRVPAPGVGFVVAGRAVRPRSAG